MRVLSARAARILTLVFFSALIGSDPAHAQTQLKVLDWNTHHGVGTDGEYNLQRFVTRIAQTGANVVSLNEVEKFTSWGNEDQPARYAALLRAATGATWHYTFAQRDGASKGQGNLILSTFPIEAADKTVLSYSRSVAMARIVVNGTRVHVFSTHLDADSSSRRATQMRELKAWAAGFAQQHIYVGDFNAWPGASEISNMTSAAYDAWAVAKASSIATAYPGNEEGNTRNSRIDYVWYSKSASRLTLKGAQVFDTRDSRGVMPSDHRPVMATFQVSGTSTTQPEPLVALPSLFSEIAADYDGDGKADVSVYRTTTGESFISRSIDRAMTTIAWGAPHLGDVSVPGDYDGDGTADLAVYRKTTGQWFIRYSSGGSTAATWGAPAYSDRPVPADYDGDGRTDIAVFRPTTAVWYLQYSSGGTAQKAYGAPASSRLGDLPVPADYNGDGRTDLAIYRGTTGQWFINGIGTSTWGAPSVGDVPVPGDYDGDRKTDLAVYRTMTGDWFIRPSTGGTVKIAWGGPALGDVPVHADYDGDGRTDLAVFRRNASQWFILGSRGGSTSHQWGSAGSGDVPLSRLAVPR